MALGRMIRYSRGSGYAATTKKKKVKRKRRMKLYKRQPTSLVSHKADFSGIFRCEDMLIGNSNSVDEKVSYAFKLDDILNATTWKTVWDQYRIDKVTIQFVPVQSQVVNRPYDDTTDPGEGISNIPAFVYMVDRDDIALTDFLTLKARPRSKEVLASQKVSCTFVPNRLYKVKVSATNTANVIDPNTQTFIDSGSSDVIHYGLKTCMEAATPDDAWQYRVLRYYHISFRGRRI